MRQVNTQLFNANDVNLTTDACGNRTHNRITQHVMKTYQTKCQRTTQHENADAYYVVY